MSNSDDSSIRRRAPVPLDKCGAALATDIISDRWTLLIIREGFYGVKRYDDMREDIDIPRSVLTQRLKKLVEHGIFEREPYREPGERTRYAYRLTEMGRDLAYVFLALMQWGDKYVKNGEPAIDVFEAATGDQLRVGFVKPEDDVISIQQTKMRPKS